MNAVSTHTGQPELWGGLECTVNRVHDRYFDQVKLTGHERRAGDLERIAGLGITTLRYPILWERTATPVGYDWTWADRQLERIRALGIEPIVGLIHHGSGPRWTNLLDDRFSGQLASFAAAVAARYPWVRRYTVVNEPLTTARFSGLYGHWYPHATSDADFVTALINQCVATTKAMNAIRRVRSDAELVQTEDCGMTFATARVTAQADFYNDRRWLTFDLLTGRVWRDHPMYAYLRRSGASERDLAALAFGNASPSVIGLNYYLTSDRFLDEQLSRYSPSMHHHSQQGGFVDVEAVRSTVGIAGHLRHIEDAWHRYGLPVALTEVHLGCSRDEQLRWFAEAWEAGCTARQNGIPFVAVTAWALMGSCYWDSLVTRPTDCRESGAFDTRGDECRPTALASMIKALAAEESFEHPALDGVAWWRTALLPAQHEPNDHRPLVISGYPSEDLLQLERACGRRGLSSLVLPTPDLHGRPAGDVSAHLRDVGAWALIVTPDTKAAEAARIGQATLGANVRLMTLSAHPGFAISAAVDSRTLSVGFASDDRPGVHDIDDQVADAALDLLIDGAVGAWRLERLDGGDRVAVPVRLAADTGGETMTLMNT